MADLRRAALRLIGPGRVRLATARVSNQPWKVVEFMFRIIDGAGAIHAAAYLGGKPSASSAARTQGRRSMRDRKAWIEE